jgi:hypothetical protein
MARTPKLSTGQKKKVEKVMHEYKEGKLKSGKRGPGKGPKVKSRKQAIAIALSEAGASRPAKSTKSSRQVRKTSPNRAGSRQTGGKRASARTTTARRSNRRSTAYESRV